MHGERMGVRRNKRYNRNPYGSRLNPTVTDIGPQFNNDSGEFKSVVAARAFLNEAEALSQANCLPKEPAMSRRITEAQEFIRKADLRNVRRQIRRMEKRGLTPSPELVTEYNTLRAQGVFYPQPAQQTPPPEINRPLNRIRRPLNGCTPIDRQVDQVCGIGPRFPRNLDEKCLDILSSRASCLEKHNKKLPRRRDKTKLREIKREISTKSAHWEEVLGPEGEVVRFILHYDEQGRFSGREPTKRSPQVGDIVLDLTTGVKAWIIKRGRRRPMSISDEMRRIYESSCLYKTRQLATGELTLDAYLKQISSIKTASYHRE